jgi:hypothetical protein
MAAPSRLELACQGDGWVRSRRVRCVAFEWSLLTNDADLIDYVGHLYEACVDGDRRPARHLFILRRHTNADTNVVSLYRDGRVVLRRVPAGLAIARLVWEVNRGVVEEAGDRLLLHAAAAQRDQGIVLVAGPEGSGKSTLITALVSSGFRYVTDETVALEPPAAKIALYPKPIALHRGIPEWLRSLCPAVPPALQAGCEEWFVPAHAIRRGAVARRGGIARLLVLPEYRPGQATAARSLSRAEAAMALAEQSFNFRAFGPNRLEIIANAVRACDCYRLVVGDLEVACRLVLDLFDTAVAVR